MAKNNKNAKQSHQEAVVTPGAVISHPDHVWVALNHAQGINFPIPGSRDFMTGKEEILTLNGSKDKQETSIPPRFGVTKVNAEALEAVKKKYGTMCIFSSPNMVIAPTLEDLSREVRGRDKVRHGLEQLRPQDVKLPFQNVKITKAEGTA